MANDQPNNGALFINNRRENDKSPEFGGTMLLEESCPHCKQTFLATWFMNAWRRVSRQGTKYTGMSFKFKEYPNLQQSSEVPATTSGFEDPPADEDYPF